MHKKNREKTYELVSLYVYLESSFSPAFLDPVYTIISHSFLGGICRMPILVRPRLRELILRVVSMELSITLFFIQCKEKQYISPLWYNFRYRKLNEKMRM